MSLSSVRLNQLKPGANEARIRGLILVELFCHMAGRQFWPQLTKWVAALCSLPKGTKVGKCGQSHSRCSSENMLFKTLGSRQFPACLAHQGSTVSALHAETAGTPFISRLGTPPHIFIVL